MSANEYTQGQAPVYYTPGYQPWETLGNWGRMDHGQAPTEPAPWAERSKRRKAPMWAVVILTIGGLFLLCAGCVGLVSGMSGDAPGSEVVDAPVYKVGQKARSGDLEYTVHGMRCGLDRVGDNPLSQKPQGSFCVVDVTVRNMARSPKTFHADTMIKAYDSDGREYSPDGVATIYANQDNASFLTEINPGNQVKAKILFDVPDGAKVSSVELSDGDLLSDDTVSVQLG